jgi:hypothetical protein
MLRSESARQVRAAELKVHDNDAPTIDDEHDAVAVYGVPDRMRNHVDSKKLADQLKKNAAIKKRSHRFLGVSGRSSCNAGNCSPATAFRTNAPSYLERETRLSYCQQRFVRRNGFRRIGLESEPRSGSWTQRSHEGDQPGRFAVADVLRGHALVDGRGQLPIGQVRQPADDSGASSTPLPSARWQTEQWYPKVSPPTSAASCPYAGGGNERSG